MSEIKSKLFILMITVGIIALFYVPSASYGAYVGPDCNELDLVNLPQFGTKVAFVSNIGSTDPDNFSLFTINSDGRDQTPNLGHLDYRDPVLISSDEKTIVFTRLVNETNQVFVGNTDGTQIHQITHDDKPKSVMAITADGKRIIYATTPANDLSSVNNFFSISIDGTNLVQITHNSEEKDWPAVSGDGSTLVFDEHNGTQGKIFQVNTNGNGLHFVTDGWLFSHTSPIISNNGYKIVFSRNNQNDSNTKYLFTINTDGSGLAKILSYPIYMQSDFTISPDGSKIAFDDFNIYDNKNSFVSIVNSDSTGYNRIINSSYYLQNPLFSHDGSKLLFTIPVGNNLGLYLAETSKKPVMVAQGQIGKALFSKDDSGILFSKYENKTTQLYVIRYNETNPTPLIDYNNFKPNPECKIPYGAGPMVVNFQLSQLVSSGNNIYVAYQKNSSPQGIFFRASNDGGRTFGGIIPVIDNPSLTPGGDLHVAASGDDVYLIWYAIYNKNNTSHVFLKKSIDDGKTFGTPQVIDSFTRNGSAFVSDMVAKGSNLFVTLNFNNYTSMRFNQIFLASSDYGNTFGKPVILTNDGSSTESKILVSGNHVYIIWEYDKCPDGMCRNQSIVFRSSDDNGTTLGPMILLSNGTEIFPQMAVSGDKVYAVWQGGQFPDIFFRKSTDGGKTFDDIIDLSKKVGESGSPQILSAGNNVYVGFYHFDYTRPNENRHLSGVYFTKSSDGGNTFSEPVRLLFNVVGSYFDLAASSSNVYLLALERDDTQDRRDVFLAQSADNGTTFEKQVNLSAVLNKSSNPGMMAADGNNLYLAGSSAFPGNDLYFTTSHDNGKTFGNTIMLNPDNSGNYNVESRSPDYEEQEKIAKIGICCPLKTQDNTDSFLIASIAVSLAITAAAISVIFLKTRKVIRK